MRPGIARPERGLLASFLLTLGVALPLSAQTRLPKPPKNTPTVVPAGPAWLRAGSTVPGQVWLTFGSVTGAQKYRVTRSSNPPEPEQPIYEADASNLIFEGPSGTYHDAPVGLTNTYELAALPRPCASTAPQGEADTSPPRALDRRAAADRPADRV